MFKQTMEPEQLKRIIEAALLAAGQPLTFVQLNELFGEEEMPGVDTIANCISALVEDCQQRGVELVEVASGWRYQIRRETQPWVARLWTERQTKYSRALLETLALIAYRQPITRAEIEQIRGVAVSTNIIKTMEEREWIRVLGHRDVPGKPAIFGTTKHFLDYFNLRSLDQLPPLAELRDFTELEPQLNLDPEAIGPVASAASFDDVEVLPDADAMPDTEDFVEREHFETGIDAEALPEQHEAGIESATTPAEDRAGDDTEAPMSAAQENEDGHEH